MKNLVMKIAQSGIVNLYSLINKKSNVYGCDLHNELFNMTYFVSNTSNAKDFLQKWDVFEAIEKVEKYEKDNFGEITTQLGDPIKLCNMLSYIVGEELMQESKTLHDNWDVLLTVKQMKKIRSEISYAVKTYN